MKELVAFCQVSTVWLVCFNKDAPWQVDSIWDNQQDARNAASMWDGPNPLFVIEGPVFSTHVPSSGEILSVGIIVDAQFGEKNG